MRQRRTIKQTSALRMHNMSLFTIKQLNLTEYLELLGKETSGFKRCHDTI